MSKDKKYINSNGTFNHGQWLRDQTLNEGYGILSMDFNDEFSQIIEMMDGEILADVEMAADEGKISRAEFTKIEKLFNKMKKDQQTLHKLLRNVDKALGNI
tara:strand:- start:375 stop:677 length:303 start_codon:yes stop_codon:yes gene_type:complete